LWLSVTAPEPAREPTTISVVMLNDAEPTLPSPALAPTEAPRPPVPQPPTAAKPLPTPPTPAATKLPSPAVLATANAGVTAATVPAPAPVSAEPASPVPTTAPPATTAAPAPPPVPATPKTLPSSAVRYLKEPEQIYPRASRELGETGVVRLRVLVDEQGRPREVEVAKSSGHPRLDQAAVLAMRGARFQPHLEDGQPRMVWVLAPLNFQLDEL
jgi:periplasmic protein TonB